MCCPELDLYPQKIVRSLKCANQLQNARWKGCEVHLKVLLFLELCLLHFGSRLYPEQVCEELSKDVANKGRRKGQDPASTK